MNPRARSGGYLLIEAVLALGILAVVLAAAGELLLRQWRFHRFLVEAASVRDSGRIALETLAAELRSASPGLGDVYGIGPDSVALRSNSALGVLCAAAGAVVRVRRLAGAFGDGRGDSVLVFSEGDPGSPLDDGWAAAAVRQLETGGVGGCPDGRPPDLTLAISDPMPGVATGAPVRGFRAYVYRLYTAGDGHWWMGQRLRDGAFQPLTGPFDDPADGGLRLEYFGADGGRTATPERVERVSISVVPRSPRPIPWYGGPRTVVDTLSTDVYLRNGGDDG